MPPLSLSDLPGDPSAASSSSSVGSFFPSPVMSKTDKREPTEESLPVTFDVVSVHHGQRVEESKDEPVDGWVGQAASDYVINGIASHLHFALNLFSN